MNINLREEATNSYISLYQNFLEDIQKLNKKVTDVLNEIMEQSRYDRLQKLISNIIDTYTETIVNNIETGVFPTWRESGGSLRACLQTYRAGDAADAVCVQIEQNMNDLMLNILNIEKADLVVTERPVVSEDGLGRLEDICQTARTEVADLKAGYISQVKGRSDENDIYGTLIPLIEGVSSNMEGFFEASFHSFNNLHAFVKGISFQLHNIAEENSANAGNAGNVGNARNAGNVGNVGAKSSSEFKKGAASSSSGTAGDAGKSPEEEVSKEENIRLLVIAVEKIVEPVGVEELNKLIEKHYKSLSGNREIYSKKKNTAKKATSKAHSSAANIYGRYTVTNKSIQYMEPICKNMDSILEPLDQFYKEKFQSLGKGFDMASKTIHVLSLLFDCWGLGKLKLSDMESEKSILEKILLATEAFTLDTKLGKAASAVKIFDKVLPHLKTSKLLVKMNELVWKAVRWDIQVPYVQRWMEQYVIEHYEMKYGMTKGQTGWFEYLHNVVTKIEDGHQRRTFENAVFAAEKIMVPINYTITETDPKKNRAIFCGVYLNFVRSGMCSKQGIESGTANNIVDKLYYTYIDREAITPRVDIDPIKQMIG